MSTKGNDYSYYASKSDLLTWVNTLLQLQLTRIEQFSSGAVYCQVLDAFHEDAVAIHKVNFFAKEEHEAVPNFKQLQTAFTHLKIVKELNVQRIAKGAKADTLELLQFMHKLLTRTEPLPSYDGRQRRAMSLKGGTDNIPVPAWMTASFDNYGRGSGFRTSSGNWGCVIEPQQSLRAQLRASGIYVPTYQTPPRTPQAPQSPTGNRRPQQPLRQSTIAAKLQSGAQKMRESYAESETDGEMLEQSSQAALSARVSQSAGLPPVPAPAASSSSVHFSSLALSDLPGLPKSGPPRQHSGAGASSAALRRAGSSTAARAAAAAAASAAADAESHQHIMILGCTGGSQGGVSSGYNSANASSSSAAGADSMRGSSFKAARGSNVSSGGRAPAVPAAAAAAVPQVQSEEAAEAPEPASDKNGAGVTIVEVQQADAGLLEAPEVPGMQISRQTDEQGSTRLTISQATLSGMARSQGASPAAQQALAQALAAAKESLAQMSKAAACVTQIAEHLSSSTDTLAFRGKVRSFLDAGTALGRYSEQLLQELLDQQRGADDEGSSTSLEASTVLCELRKAMQQHSTGTAQLIAALEAAQQPATGNMPLTQLQKQVTNTAGLEGALRQTGMALTALMHLQHRTSAGAAERYLAEPAAEGGAPRVLKLGDFHMKRLKNGDVYKGKYQHGRKNGCGVYHFTNGDVYQGQFANDRMEGRGVYAFGPEGLYEGGWKGAVYSGHGAEHFTKGSTYRGEYQGGVRHGHGCCRFLNGDFYEGSWAKGLREGTGMQQCTDDSNYVGEYSAGKRHGHGVYSFPNGDQYLGEYCDDIPHGYGVYLFSSGQRYEGHWAKGKKHGWSIYTVETGQRWAGSWGEGKPQWVHPVLPDGSPEGVGLAELPAEAQLNLNTSVAAHKNALAAAKVALERAAAHWANEGEMQSGLAAALEGSRTAVATSQEVRSAMVEHVTRLDAAALLIWQGGQGQGQQIGLA